MPDFEKNNYYKIIDIKTNAIICAGKIAFIKQTKDMPILISFDNKFFFNSEGTSKYKVVKSDTEVDVPLLRNIILESYKICLYEDYFNYPDYDIFREYDINELDEPVIKLVTILNKFDDIETTGSCCGHGDNYLWVDIMFHSLSSINLIIDLLNDDKWNNKFILSNYYTNKNKSNYSVMLHLRSFTKGEEAYKDDSLLADDLQEIYELLYGL